MRFLSGFSIRAKLSLLTCVVTFTAVAAACLGFAGLGFHQLCTSEALQLKHHAELLGHYGTPIVTLGNRTEGERLLASLASDPSIKAAGLFDFEQNCISRYGDAKSLTFPFHLKGKPYRLASLNRLEILSQIDAAGQPIGFIYLRSDTSAAQAKIGQFARGSGIIFLVVLGVCCLVAVPFKRAVSKPLLLLARAADDFTHGENPSLSTAGQFSPECLQVLDVVNRLIAKTEKSVHVADRATTGLEDRVAESNHGLAQELKRLQKRQHDLERAKEVAEAASLAKSSFVVDMSQEMRGPLEHIVNNVKQLLSNQQAGGDQGNTVQLDAIYRDGQQLQRLVQDVSEIARVAAGRVEFDRVNCLPQSVIADAVAQYQSQADAKGLAFEYLWRGSDQESMCCDPERLRQVVEVLVSNAIRFTELGGVRVVARFEQGQDSRQLCIEVTDTGIGMDAENLDRVLGPSEQPTCVPRDGDGDGDGGDAVLGLHSCRTIVAALGGDISVNSSVGEGSVFTVMLDADVNPLTPTGPVAGESHGGRGDSLAPAQPVEASSQSRAASGDPSGAACGPTPAAKILVVDDSDTNRDLTQLVLRRAGARVEGAENGLEAVQAAIRDSFDLILMDMQMPVMDGFSATREIRAQGIDVPIIALTAFARDFDEQKCRAAGCIGHLIKPVDTEDLLNAAERVLPRGKTLTRTAQPIAKPPTPAAAAKRRSPYDLDLDPQPSETART